LGSFNLSAGSISITDSFIADGTAGLSGQVLTSQGPGNPAIWSYVVGNQDLNSVLNVGNVGNLNINLINANGYAKIDVQKIFGNPAMYLYDAVLTTNSSWAIDKLHLEDVNYKVDYTTNKIRYSLGAKYI